MTINQLRVIASDFPETLWAITPAGVQVQYSGAHLDLTIPALERYNMNALTKEVEGFIEQTDETNGA